MNLALWTAINENVHCVCNLILKFTRAVPSETVITLEDSSSIPQRLH